MAHDQFLVDHGSDTGRHRVQHQAGGKRLGNGNPHVAVIGGLDQLIDVFGGPAELGDDKSRGLVELDDPL